MCIALRIHIDSMYACSHASQLHNIDLSEALKVCLAQREYKVRD